jgi:hypothetical protein
MRLVERKWIVQNNKVAIEAEDKRRNCFNLFLEIGEQQRTVLLLLLRIIMSRRESRKVISEKAVWMRSGQHKLRSCLGTDGQKWHVRQ